MDAYLKENVPALQDCYVGPVCNKPRDEFIPRVDVVKGQMVIVQSPELDCAIWLGMAIGDIYQESDASTVGSYKVEVQWWKPTGASKDLKVLYKNCLYRKQQWVVGAEENMMIDGNKIIRAWSPRKGWTGEKIRINEKGLATVKEQREHMGHNVQSGMDVA